MEPLPTRELLISEHLQEGQYKLHSREINIFANVFIDSKKDDYGSPGDW